MMSVAAARYDNHLGELIDEVLPDIAEALRVGDSHPDASRLIDRAYTACIDAFPVVDGWDSGAGWMVFRTLVAVVDR